MAKKNTSSQKITYTEILCLAITQLEGQMEGYRQKLNTLPDDSSYADMLNSLISPLKEKQDTIKQLYKIETGVDYN